jgi:hypothetical protein
VRQIHRRGRCTATLSTATQGSFFWRTHMFTIKADHCMQRRGIAATTPPEHSTRRDPRSHHTLSPRVYRDAARGCQSTAEAYMWR